MRGPIDYIIVGFKNKKFDGSILRALGEAVESGAINVLAIVAVAKDADGTVTNINLVDTGDDYVVEFSQKYQLDDSMVDQTDIDEVGELLETGESAGLLIVEQLWAKPLKQALIQSNAVLLAEGRIHPEAAAELDA